MMRSSAYNRFGVLMGTSWPASCPRWYGLREDSLPMRTLFPSQGDFYATASTGLQPLIATSPGQVGPLHDVRLQAASCHTSLPHPYQGSYSVDCRFRLHREGFLGSLEGTARLGLRQP